MSEATSWTIWSGDLAAPCDDRASCRVTCKQLRYLRIGVALTRGEYFDTYLHFDQLLVAEIMAFYK